MARLRLKIVPKAVLTVAAATMTLLTACADADSVGRETAQAFARAWRGDTIVLAQWQHVYDARLDSLPLPWQSTMMSRAFIDALDETGSDSLQIAGRAITMPLDEFVDHYATQVVDCLLNDADKDRATTVLHAVHDVVDYQRRAAFDRAVEARVQALPLAQRMTVFARATTPAQLGRAIADEVASGVTTIDQASAMRDALHSIYGEQDYAAFVTALGDSIP